MPGIVSIFCSSVIFCSVMLLLDVIAGFSCVVVDVDSALQALSDNTNTLANKILYGLILNSFILKLT